MQILIDADACPKVIKEILFRAADRHRLHTTLVANKLLYCPPSPFIHALQVPAGFDVADNKIVEMTEAGDLIITADIPLAAEVIAKDGHVLNPRGELYTKDSIKERLAMRDFMDVLRSSGVETGGPATLGQKDRQAFANQLDRFLAKHLP